MKGKAAGSPLGPPEGTGPVDILTLAQGDRLWSCERMSGYCSKPLSLVICNRSSKKLTWPLLLSATFSFLGRKRLGGPTLFQIIGCFQVSSSAAFWESGCWACALFMAIAKMGEKTSRCLLCPWPGPFRTTPLLPIFCWSCGRAEHQWELEPYTAWSRGRHCKIT